MTPLGDYLRIHKDEILHAWGAELSSGIELPPMRELSPPALVDHVPEILDGLATMVSAPVAQASGTDREMVELTEAHVVERFEQGFEPWQLVRELSLLRRCVLRLWRAETPVLRHEDAERITVVFDLAIELAIRHMAGLQHEITEAVERIATAALESEDEQVFLARLLRIFVDTAPSVDSATILLRDGDHLRAFASIGAEEDVQAQYSVAIGFGFVGAIAQARAPALWRAGVDANDAISQAARSRGTRVLFGVPLLEGDELVGVATIGSRSVEAIPSVERRLFTTVAARATFALVKQRLREVALRRGAELESVIRAIPDAVLVVTTDRMSIWNRAAVDLLGIEEEDMLRTKIEDVVQRIDLHEPGGRRLLTAEMPLTRALLGERVRGEVVARNAATGADISLRVSAAPIEVDGAIVGAVAVCTDLTELKELERERATYVNAVIHDLRNPLGAVHASLQVTREQIDSLPRSELARRLSRIEANTGTMSRLLDDLFELSLAVSQNLPVHLERVDIYALAQERVAIWARESDVHDVLVTDGDGTVFVLADPVRVRQVLDNLISNAIKYSPQGGPVVVGIEPIAGGQARISVSDQGMGITKEEQQRLTHPYVRMNKNDAKGHGLGLFICAQLIRAQNGELAVESEPGKGSTFRFSLPMAEPTQA